MLIYDVMWKRHANIRCNVEEIYANLRCNVEEACLSTMECGRHMLKYDVMWTRLFRA